MDIALLFLSLTQTFNLPPGLLSSVCYVESHHNANAIHHDDGGSDSVGLCQIHKSTAEQLGYRGSDEDLKDPKTNAFWAGLYLVHQYHRYGNDPIKAIAAYNAGSYAVNEKGQIKNRLYVAKVLKAWSEGR